MIRDRCGGRRALGTSILLLGACTISHPGPPPVDQAPASSAPASAAVVTPALCDAERPHLSLSPPVVILSCEDPDGLRCVARPEVVIESCAPAPLSVNALEVELIDPSAGGKTTYQFDDATIPPRGVWRRAIALW